MERIFPFLRIGYDTGVFLYRLFRRNHAALRHQFVDPANTAVIISFQHLIFHLETFVDRNTVLYHFVYAGILLHKSGFHQTHQNMAVTFIIIGAFRTFDHTDIEQHHFTAYTVNFILCYLNILAPHNIIANVFQLRRHDLRNKLFGEHTDFTVFGSFDLIAEIF